MKKYILILIIMWFFIAGTSYAANEGPEDILKKQQDAIGIDDLKTNLDTMLSPETDDIIPRLNIKDIFMDIASGKMSINMKDTMNRLLRFFFKEVYVNLKSIAQVIVLVLICALLKNLQGSFSKEGIGEIAFYSCYILLAVILIKNFVISVNLGKQVIDNMVLFMQSFIPTIFALLISTGNVATSTVLQPSIIFVIEIVSTLIKTILFPMILFYSVLAIVSNISDKVQVSKLAGFIKNIGMWLIGVLLMAFVTIIGMQGKITAVADGISAKTAKMAVSNFVPIVGKALSDVFDTVVGYSLILKNSVSVVGMIIIILICAVPVIKLFAMVTIYRLTAAAIQPISDERIVKCITEMVNSLTFVSAAVISVSVMFLVSISIMINAGNATAMLR